MTNDDLVFYTNPYSRARIVRWMLEEVGQPYRAVVLGYGPPMKTPEYLAINPMGKVPTLVHRGTVVTETAAICAYLADAFPQAGLAPATDSPLRGPYYRWMFFAAGPMEQSISNRSLGLIPPEDKVGMVGYGGPGAMERAVATAVVPGPYILGEQFSAADVLVGSYIGWAAQAGLMDSTPELDAYAARVGQRPAAVRAREIDDALHAEMSKETT